MWSFRGIWSPFWSCSPHGVLVQRRVCQRRVRAWRLMAFLNTSERSCMHGANWRWFVRWNNTLEWSGGCVWTWEESVSECLSLCALKTAGGGLSWRCIFTRSLENGLECVFFLWKVKLGTGGNKPISSNLISCKLEGWKSESSMWREREGGAKEECHWSGSGGGIKSDEQKATEMRKGDERRAMKGWKRGEGKRRRGGWKETAPSFHQETAENSTECIKVGGEQLLMIRHPSAGGSGCHGNVRRNVWLWRFIKTLSQ